MRLDIAGLVVVAGVTAAIHVGKLPPALPVLQAELGLTLVQGGFLLSLVQLAAMTCGLAVGLAADSLGLRRVMVCGLLLLGCASLLGASTPDPAALLVLRAVEGLGFLLAVTCGPSLIRRHIPAPGLPARLGLWGAYMPLGTSLALLVGPAWISVLGWSAWWGFTGLLPLLLAAVLWIRLPPDPVPIAPAAVAASAGWRIRLQDTLRSPGPWWVALAFAAYSAQWLSVIGFLPTVYAQSGFEPVTAGVASAVVAAVNMMGNIASGRLLQRGLPPQALMRVGFAAMALGALGLYLPVWPTGAGGLWGPYLSVLIFSAAGGLVPGTLFSQAVRLAPSAGTVSTTVGWMQQWSSLGQFAGPPLVAWVASQAGGWHWSGLATGTCAAAGWWLAGRIGRTQGGVSAAAS